MVDTQVLLWRLMRLWQNNKSYNVQYSADPYEEEVDTVFVNTCGFLRSWRQEMLETVQKLADAGKNAYVMWCGWEYFEKTYKDQDWQLSQEDPDYAQRKKLLHDKKLNLLSWKDFETVTIQDIKQWYSSVLFDGFHFVSNPRAYTNAMYKFEYCKIAEWCNNTCSFCIIPKIRGKQRSVTIEKVLEDIHNMVDAWIEEIIILAQDTTRYGTDIYWQPKLFELLEKIEAMEWDFMFRVLYLYPDILSLQHIKKLRRLKKFIPYFDIPLQHSSSPVLKRMGRFYDEAKTYEFLRTIKDLFPEWYIRTNFIIWFPGETDKDFQHLLNFVRQDFFDNVALFEYHDEILAPSSKLDQKVDDETISARFEIIKDIREPMYDEKQKQKMNSDQEFDWYVMDVREQEDGTYLLKVRPTLHAPDIDPYDDVLVENIIASYDGEDVDVWSKIRYTLS